MQLLWLAHDFCVCQLPTDAEVDWRAPFTCVFTTNEEISLVCKTSAAPQTTLKKESGWRALRVVGVLDFSLTGILAGLTEVLKQADIGVFAISTYNTDYLLVKAVQARAAQTALCAKGYVFLKDVDAVIEES